MPLPPSSSARREIHRRTVTCTGYLREDGLWDIEGQLTDVKTYPFENAFRGEVVPGDPIHGMWLRLTVDDQLTIHAVDAVTDKSPFAICPNITPRFKRLEGLTIKPGFNRAVKELLGGVQSCTHLVEMLGPMATTAFQTVFPYRARERELARRAEGQAPMSHAKASASTGGDKARRPRLLNSCHVFDSAGEFARDNWPDHYTGPRPPGQVGAG